MSIAELKEKIVREVILSNDEQFLIEVEEFISEKTNDGNVSEIDLFYDRLKGQYATVLQKLNS